MNLAPVRHILRAIATTVVPESASLDERAWGEVEAVIAHALASRGPRMQRQLVVFLRLVQTLPIARYARPLTGLTARQRHAFLESVERSRLQAHAARILGGADADLHGLLHARRCRRVHRLSRQPDGWTARGGTVATVPLAPTLWVEP